MDDNETLVILAINIGIVQLPLFEDLLKENNIDYFVTGGNQGYGVRGDMYLPKGINSYTIRVRKKDEERAIKVMHDMGFNVFNEDDEEQNFLETLAFPTEKIPFLAKYSLNTRLAIMGLAITAIITIIILGFLRTG